MHTLVAFGCNLNSLLGSMSLLFFFHAAIRMILTAVSRVVHRAGLALSRIGWVREATEVSVARCSWLALRESLSVYRRDAVNIKLW